MFDRLLLPLDGSVQAEVVLPVAARLAQAFRSTLLLLHVIERNAPATVHGELHLTDAAAAAAYLARIAGLLRSQGLAVETHVHTVPLGDVPRSIAEHAQEEQTDLIVLCTHGPSGWRDLVAGNVAQQALQHGNVPLLMVRAPGAGQAPAPFAPADILLPLDTTEAAEAALAPATALAKAFKARLHLVSVVATADTLSGRRAPTASLLPSATRALLEIEQDETATYLARLADRLRAAGAPVSTEVRRGDTLAQLSADHSEHHFGLIVLATHGRAGLPARLSGSVAARLIGSTSAPVLLIRRLDRE